MDGIILEDVPIESIVSFVGKNFDGVCAEWSASSLDDMLSSLPEGEFFDGDELSHRQMDLPWLTNSGYVSVRTVVARAKGSRASAFLINTSWNVITSDNLEEDLLFDFYREEYNGNQADLRWYADNLEKMAKLADWSIWSGLPDPVEVGRKSLVVAKNVAMIKFIAKAISECIEGPLGGCGAEDSSNSGGKVRIVDVRGELVRVQQSY